ncbi:MAG: putative esterase of the alpha-beta hydrolase superfamily [Phycisphaerales bacterium]|nr:putative esterase of the alpha-beta hydrolase superfamily [Phycisphaerales bacterium]
MADQDAVPPAAPAPGLPVQLLPTETPAAARDDAADGIALCLSGGGYRAMLFHVGTVLRLNHAGLLRKLNRVSSVSGGSLTAGALAVLWDHLEFDAKGIAQRLDLFVSAVRAMARATVDEGAVLGGLFLPGQHIADRVIRAYDDTLFHGQRLKHLPDEVPGKAPRFVFCATNVQSGALFRFSKPFVGDYRIGGTQHLEFPLAVAVAASSAFPPILSPVTIKWDGPPFARKPDDRIADLNFPPYTTELVLTDGGVYDNMGLETAWKNYKTVLVSDAGLKMAAEPKPKADWAQHSLRVLDLIDNQVRSLRKRQLVQSYIDGQRKGAYWGIRTDIADYGLADPMPAPFARSLELAAVKTRLKRVDEETQERLINWGYAVCDAALRAHVDPALPKGTFLYPRGV